MDTAEKVAALKAWLLTQGFERVTILDGDQSECYGAPCGARGHYAWVYVSIGPRSVRVEWSGDGANRFLTLICEIHIVHQPLNTILDVVGSGVDRAIRLTKLKEGET